jgi:hypothetical protein
MRADPDGTIGHLPAAMAENAQGVVPDLSQRDQEAESEQDRRQTTAAPVMMVRQGHAVLRCRLDRPVHGGTHAIRRRRSALAQNLLFFLAARFEAL